MSGLIQESIDRKRREAIKTGVALMKLLTPSEADFLREQRRQAANASVRRSYARNRAKEISDQVRKQRTPEGKAAKLYFNTLARARRWGDKELESALLDERAQKGKAALVDVPAIMLRLGRGRKWRIKPVQPIQPKQPRKQCPSKWSQLTRETIFELTKGGETALHRAIKGHVRRGERSHNQLAGKHSTARSSVNATYNVVNHASRAPAATANLEALAGEEIRTKYVFPKRSQVRNAQLFRRECIRKNWGCVCW